MVCLNAPLGFHPPLFFPQNAGKDYALSPYLELIKEFRDDFTVMSGLSHPEVGEGHDSSYSFLTGAHHNGFVFQGGFRNTISLDQLAAEHIGLETRYPTLSFTIGGDILSWTRTGVPIQADMSTVRGIRPAFPGRHSRTSSSPGPSAALRPERPRPGRRAGQGDAHRPGRQ